MSRDCADHLPRGAPCSVLAVRHWLLPSFHSLKREIVEATYRLRHIRLHTVPNFDVGGGCDPYFDVRLGDGKQMTFDYKKVGQRHVIPLAGCMLFYPALLQALKGKVKNFQPKHSELGSICPLHSTCLKSFSSAEIIDLGVWDFNIRVKGDVKIVFYDHDTFSAPDKMVRLVAYLYSAVFWKSLQNVVPFCSFISGSIPGLSTTTICSSIRMFWIERAR